MENKKHWQSFGELKNSEAYQQSTKDEFKEELPFEAADNSSFLQATTPRRDFLKYLGFSTAAAAVAASCEIPVKKAIPFANRPENIVPGVAQWYATTYVQDGEAVSVLAKVRDGRPVKIEGNEMSPITQGGTSSRVQASVLDLYDTARVRKPMIKGSNNQFNEATFDSIDKAIAADFSGLSKPLVLLTGTVISPSTKDVITQFLAKFPGGRHVQYDAISYSGLLQANEQTGHGRRIASYRFDRAKTIVSLAADFLGSWLSPVEFNKMYAKGRKINEKNPTMSKHFQFEPVLSQTGANADERYLCLPSQIGNVAAALLGAVNGGGATGISDKALADGIARAAAELKKGGGLVVSGSNDVNVQVIVNAINAAIGANGTTVDWSTPLNTKQGIDGDMATLVNDMKAGNVGALLIHEANPVYNWVDAAGFTEGLKKVPVTISFNPKLDETATLCKYILSDNHYLESWGDAEPKPGYYSFIQPTIFPLFKTRQWQDSLLKWSGNPQPYAAFLKQYWSAKSGGEAGWDKILQDGVLNPGGSAVVSAPVAGRYTTATTPKPVTTPVITTATGGAGSFNGGTVGAAVTAVNGKKGGKVELFLYQKNSVGANGAANPWLMEVPDPVTRASWDNYVIISPIMAKELLGIDLNNNGEADSYEVNPGKKVVKVTYNGKSVELPAVIVPGVHPNAIGIAVGYGRIASVGKASQDKGQPIGKNVFQFATWNNGTVDYANPNVTIEKASGTYDVAFVQTHNTYDTPHGKRTEVMKELSLAEFQHNPKEVYEERETELKPWGGLKDYEKKGTLYPYHDKPGVKWGMSIDLNSCTGCHACVVACHIENNVPVVGKSEVMRFHDMHWLRIDRYYSGDMNNPNVVFQPMLCQHCDNAPCENVCPVAATMHNQEGVNQMIYNRCIGTRYCANNCPYKVRRFNWSDYMGADSFPGNQEEWDELRIDQNDPLTRMVLNPDVTVRSRGVMEKCSFCVQRTQEGKLKAKKESRQLVTGEEGKWDVKTACQQACPADAITFGNVHSSHSAISIHRAENPYRTYYSLEQLHTLPNVNYLAKIRNTDRMEHSGTETGGHKNEAKQEGKAGGGTHGN